MLGRVLIGLVVLGLAGLVAWRLLQQETSEGRARGERAPAPVLIAPITVGPIGERRLFSGSLRAAAAVTVISEVDGELLAVPVDLGDAVSPGTLVAEIDATRYRQAEAEAEAAVAVARARLAQARSAVGVAESTFDRVDTLRQRGVVADAEREQADADRQAAAAAVALAEAQVQAAEAAAAQARLDRERCEIRPRWPGEAPRLVGARLVDTGTTVRAGQELLTLLAIDELVATVQVTERDYARLHPDQAVTLQVDAWPGETFPGTVARIAPRFDRGTRQALVEVVVANPDHRLKPGMFARAGIQLDEAAEAIVVPAQALTERGERTVVFVVDAAGERVRAVPVTVGIRSGDRVQVTGSGLEGRVVILGQQLIEDGSAVTIPERAVVPAAVETTR